MSEVRSGGANRERIGIVTIAALVLGGVGLYLALGSRYGSGDAARNLLPYQVLVRTLAEQEQQMYTAIRRGLPEMEAERARTSRWGEPLVFAANNVSPFSLAAEHKVEWHRFQRGATTQYFGQPADPAAPSWILTIQEPEPNTPPDPAPLDDEHHRLPDGTTLHIYVWMRRVDGQAAPSFVPLPQNDGWTELFATPPNPVIPPPSR